MRSPPIWSLASSLERAPTVGKPPSSCTGQLVKRRERRHVVHTTTRTVCGQRQQLVQRLLAAGLSGLIQTYAIERVNLTLRQGVALLTRRTWSLAQSELHLYQHVGWWQAYYHLVRPHQALRLPVPGLKHRFRPRSPAMALGLTSHLWSVGEFLRLRPASPA
jgi:transposase InsO family protein